MKLGMLAKDGSSGDQGCDSCYLGDDRRAYVQAGEASPEVYAAAKNLIRAFLAGRTPQPHPGKREWMTLTGAAIRDSRRMQRVHVVTEPITDYVRFEVAWSYAYSVAAGEDVRIIPVPEGQPWPSEIGTSDFWLFDDTELFTMHYDADSTWTGVEHRRDPAAASAACQVRDAALRCAQPWAAYVSSVPELARRVPPWLT